MTKTHASMADDCEALLRLMADSANDAGVSIEEIRAATGWAGPRIHGRLLDLGRKVAHSKVRDYATRQTEIRYRLRPQGG